MSRKPAPISTSSKNRAQMNQKGADFKGQTDIGGVANEKPHSRTDLPEYKRWQEAMQPENSGQGDGAVGVPAATDTVSLFDSRVRDNLNSRLGVVQSKFAADDAAIAIELGKIRSEYEHFKALLGERRTIDRRPVLVSIGRKAGSALIFGAYAISSVLFAVLWLDKGINPLVAVTLAALGAAVAALAAYPCGLAFRQAPMPWQRWLAASILVLLMLSLIALAANMKTPSFDTAERSAIGALSAAAIGLIAAAAFMMNDPDPSLVQIERNFTRLRDRMATLTVSRVETKEFHTNVARRHVELARQVISSYRQSNTRARPSDMPPPPFFIAPAELPVIEADWLKHLESEEL